MNRELGKLRESASRIGTMAPLNPITTGQNMGIVLDAASNMIADRPITQHGLSGLPSGMVRARSGAATSFATQRLIKDRRYWQSTLQVLIQDIEKEATRLRGERHAAERESSAQKVYETQVRDISKKLTGLQSELMVENFAIECSGTGYTRQQVVAEALALRERYETDQQQLETVFQQRVTGEAANKDLEQAIVNAKGRLESIVFQMSATNQTVYASKKVANENLRTMVAQLQSASVERDNTRDNLLRICNAVQTHADAFRYRLKLTELKTRLATAVADSRTNLSSEEERAKLIGHVRNRNQSLTKINRQLQLTNEQLNDRQNTMAALAQDMDEGRSERQDKYRELKRRDETMSTFLDTYDENLRTEQLASAKLRDQIAYIVEQITLHGTAAASSDIKATISADPTAKKLLVGGGGGGGNGDGGNDNLKQEHHRLSIMLRQLRLLERRTLSQFDELQQRHTTLTDDIDKYEALDALRMEAANRTAELTAELDELRHKQTVTADIVRDTQTQLDGVRYSLRSNETYRTVSNLEERLKDTEHEIKVIRAAIEVAKTDCDYDTVRRSCMDTVTQIMTNISNVV